MGTLLLLMLLGWFVGTIIMTVSTSSGQDAETLDAFVPHTVRRATGAPAPEISEG